MGRAKRIKIDDVRRDLASPDGYTRGHAINTLMTAMFRQPELQAPARDIFRRVAEHDTYDWAVTTSLIGLEQLDGPDAALPHWHRLLWQADVDAAARVAMAISHPSHLPMMLELIEARPNFGFRRSAIYALGRMRDPSVIPLLIRLAEDKALEQQVVQALGEIGDPRAIPWLQPLTHSDEHLPELDERGATWTLGDIAGQAIRLIEHRGGQRAARVLSATGSRQPTPAPLPANWANEPVTTARRPWSLIHPSLIPLAAVGLELTWLFALFALYLFMVGDQKPTFTVSDRVINAIALPLPVVGLVAAITLLLGGLTPRVWHKVVAFLGGLICGYFVFVFGHHFLIG